MSALLALLGFGLTHLTTNTIVCHPRFVDRASQRAELADRLDELRARKERWRHVGGEYARARGYRFTDRAIFAVVAGLAMEIDPSRDGTDRITICSSEGTEHDLHGRKLEHLHALPERARTELAALRIPFELTSCPRGTTLALHRPTYSDLDAACAAIVALVARAAPRSPYR